MSPTAVRQEFCGVLSELHDRAPEHSWRASKREIEAVFGKSVEELFDSIEHQPLASGSIAQVSTQAITSSSDNELTPDFLTAWDLALKWC